MHACARSRHFFGRRLLFEFIPHSRNRVKMKWLSIPHSAKIIIILFLFVPFLHRLRQLKVEKETADYSTVRLFILIDWRWWYDGVMGIDWHRTICGQHKPWINPLRHIYIHISWANVPELINLLQFRFAGICQLNGYGAPVTSAFSCHQTIRICLSIRSRSLLLHTTTAVVQSIFRSVLLTHIGVSVKRASSVDTLHCGPYYDLFSMYDMRYVCVVNCDYRAVCLHICIVFFFPLDANNRTEDAYRRFWRMARRQHTQAHQEHGRDNAVARFIFAFLNTHSQRASSIAYRALDVANEVSEMSEKK